MTRNYTGVIKSDGCHNTSITPLFKRKPFSIPPSSINILHFFINIGNSDVGYSVLDFFFFFFKHECKCKMCVSSGAS